MSDGSSDPTNSPLDDPPARKTCELEDDWAELREPRVPDLPDEELAQFVLDFCDNRIFTSAQVPEAQILCVGTVFLPLLFLDISGWFDCDVKRVGLVWEYYGKALPRSINGMPIFGSCHLLSAPDWDRARPAIEREMERRANAAKTMFASQSG